MVEIGPVEIFVIDHLPDKSAIVGNRRVWLGGEFGINLGISGGWNGWGGRGGGGGGT